MQTDKPGSLRYERHWAGVEELHLLHGELWINHHDWLAIGEFPDEKAAASAVLLLRQEAVCLTSRRPWL
jgi:hypothetical protein